MPQFNACHKGVVEVCVINSPLSIAGVLGCELIRPECALNPYQTAVIRTYRRHIPLYI